MPELPEVEVTCQGIAPHMVNQTVNAVTIRETRLRWPLPEKIIRQQLVSQKILSVSRRAKYIYIRVNTGYLIMHLGMSGTIRICNPASKLKKHDHFDCVLSNDLIMRFNDPRRFGSILWATDPNELKIISTLGPEPFSDTFSGAYLFQQAQKRHLTIKQFIMNNQIVVGVGNIYASESLFLAKIHPQMPASQLTLKKANQLCAAIRAILEKAITQGGTTLKDYYQSDGSRGYFSNELAVYDRKGLPCLKCKQAIDALPIAQRMTYFCNFCQVLPKR